MCELGAGFSGCAHRHKQCMVIIMLDYNATEQGHIVFFFYNVHGSM